MRLVVQRVKRASVIIENEVAGSIDRGMVVLLGVGANDSVNDIDWAVEKIAGLRIFDDQCGKMNLSVEDICGGVLVVSQFTLYGDAKKGRRPSFVAAAHPEPANRIYTIVCERLRSRGLFVQTGRFAAMMDVELVNDGPVTILLDSEKKF